MSCGHEFAELDISDSGDGRVTILNGAVLQQRADQDSDPSRPVATCHTMNQCSLSTKIGLAK